MYIRCSTHRHSRLPLPTPHKGQRKSRVSDQPHCQKRQGPAGLGAGGRGGGGVGTESPTDEGAGPTKNQHRSRKWRRLPLAMRSILASTSVVLPLTDAVEWQQLNVQPFHKDKPVLGHEAEVLSHARALCQASEIGSPLQPVLSNNLRKIIQRARQKNKKKRGEN